jgi:nucleotide-binding universal stress UspA family protein
MLAPYDSPVASDKALSYALEVARMTEASAIEESAELIIMGTTGLSGVSKIKA